MLIKSNKEVSQALITTNGQKSTKNVKAWSEYSAQYKRIKTRQFASNVATALTFVENDNFTTTDVQFVNKDTGKCLHVDSDGKSRECKHAKVDNVVEKTMYVKDKYRISNKVYLELTMVHPELPRSSKLNKKAKEMDAKCTITSAPGKVSGVQQSILERLKKVLKWLVTADSILFPDKHVQVKLTGDGTSISQSAYCIVVAFTIINHAASPMSPRGNHTVAIINSLEDYNTLYESLTDI